jgi:stage V sporulation protein G
MPSISDGDNWRDVCKPITSDFRKQLTDAVAEGYGVAIEKLEATLAANKALAKNPQVAGALKDNAEKPSVAGALKDNAEKAKSQPVKPPVAKEAPAL